MTSHNNLPPETTSHGYETSYELGTGSHSTVWDAMEVSTGCAVALKVGRAEDKDLELSIYMFLQARASAANSWAHVVELLDAFELHENNGEKRQCLVLERMDCTAPVFFELKGNSIGLAKQVVKQVLKGLKFLHECGVVHGNVHLGNILVRRRAGTDSKVFDVKISDLGAAFRSAYPPKNHVTPTALRSPEHIILSRVDFKADIWSLGCLLYEFCTGQPLFNVWALPRIPQEEIDNEHLLDMVDCLGLLPLQLAEKWPRYNRYFGPKGQRIGTNPGCGEVSNGEKMVFGESLAERLVNGGLVDAEVVMRKILAYEKEDRLSAQDLLEDEFFVTVH